MAAPSPNHTKQDTQVPVLVALMDETRLLFHRMGAIAEQIHRQGEMTGGLRGVMESLAREGPQTVPQLARARPVSRQHIQSLVNPLAGEGYVQFLPNPAHKRSPLVSLTARGKALITGMIQRESKILNDLDPLSTEEELRAATQVLQKFRAAFEGHQWDEILSRHT